MQTPPNSHGGALSARILTMLAAALFFSDFHPARGAEPPSISASFHTFAVKADGTVLVSLAPPSFWPDYGQGNIGAWSGLRSVSTASSHSVGLRNDGTVIATGDNFYGQCNVSDWTDIRSLAAGYQFTLGLRSNGTVVATGGNDAGQLNVSGWSNMVAIASGGEHTLGLRTDGTVAVVGTNRFGQCNVTHWTNIVAIAAGSVHSLGLKSDGTVLAAGTNLFYGETNVGGFSNIVAISAGAYHSLGLRADGTVAAVGANWADQCALSGWSNIVAVAGGFGHTVGLKVDHTLLATGDNQYGQSNVWHWYLGNDAVPPVITYLPRSETALAGGGARFHVRAAGPGPVTYRWQKQLIPMVDGGRIQGVTTPTLTINEAQSSDATSYSVKISNPHGAVISPRVQLTLAAPLVPRRPAIAAGALHTIGLKANGTMLAVGNNDYGTGQTNVTTWSNIASIAAGGYHSVGVKTDGTVLATGWANNHQIDVGSWQNVVNAAAGVVHTVGLKADGTVLASTDAINYGRVSGWSNIVELAATENSSLGLMSNGTVVASANCDGLRDVYGACQVERLTNVVQIAAGYFHAVGLRADGTVIAVGSNYFGVCLVSNWNNIIAIAAGSYHTVGLRSDGTVVATGANSDGECNVSGWSNIVAISANDTRTVGLKADDTAIATGRDGNDVATWYLGTNFIAPIMTESPTNQTVFQFRTAVLSGTAAGAGPVRYEWLRDGASLQNGGRVSGATNRSLAIARAELSDSGNYALVAISPFGRTTSSVARLEIIPAPAISVSTETTLLTFDTAPPLGNWFWTSVAGAGLTSIAQLDAAVQNLEIGIVTNAPVTTSFVQPGSERYAYWNSTSRALQTRPGGGAAFVALMATVQNDTGRPIDWLHIAYDVNVTPGADAIPGFRVYFSTAGTAGSWQFVPALSVSSTGIVETALNANVAPGERIYLLWADANTPSTTDPLRSIDNLRLASGVRLSIYSLGQGRFDITWPAAVTSYLLHSRTNLHSPSIPVPEPDTPDDQRHHVVVTNTASRFFHLQP